MDAQTLLLWAARLACPLAIGAMLWFMLRQTSPGPDQSPARHLADLQRRHAAVEHEIKGLEVPVDQNMTGGSGQPQDLENPGPRALG